MGVYDFELPFRQRFQAQVLAEVMLWISVIFFRNFVIKDQE
jgi:hypothetical protein